MGVGTEFLAQSGDVHIDGAVADNDVAPNGFHQLLARENLTAIRQQQVQQVELGAGEDDFVAVDGDHLLVEVHFMDRIGNDEYQLNDIEQKISLLIRLKFNLSEIKNLLALSSQNLTNIRSGINKKLFNDNSAKRLDSNIKDI